jgi:hypothetical protein
MGLLQEHCRQPSSYLVQLTGQPFAAPVLGENEENMISKIFFLL